MQARGLRFDQTTVTSVKPVLWIRGESLRQNGIHSNVCPAQIVSSVGSYVDDPVTRAEQR